ncbi:MAG TPA: hypothetical protein VGS22_14455 [Thermoanaerobaculia bacterium]|jgi:hypothetical protein|nr:hypothetical protein [Thermoanaerobaculia bacterium]
MRRAVSLASILVLSVLFGCGKALESNGPQNMSAPASRLEIRLPEQGFVAGQPGQIEVRLIDAEGHPAPTAKALTIELASADGLGLPESVEISAGSAGVDVAANPAVVGLVSVEARVKDDSLDPAYATAATLEAPKPTLVPVEGVVEKLAAPAGAEKLGTAVVMHELSLNDVKARPSGRWTEILKQTSALQPVNLEVEKTETTTPGTTEAPPPPPPPVAPPGPPPTPMPVAAGQVVLRASPGEVVCGPGGWRPARIDAFWMVGKKPTKTAEPIEISLTARGRGGSIDPSALTIPANGFQSATPVAVKGQAAGRIEVEALSAGNESAEPIAIDIVADPGRLDLSGDQKIRGLAVAHPTVTLRLVDPKDPNVALPVDKPITVLLQVTGPIPIKPQPITIDPATNSGSATIDLERHGEYHLTATSACIAAGTLSIAYLLDWMLIGVAAGAGLLGSLVSHRPRSAKTTAWQKAVRVAGGAIVAGLFALGLASFGLLSVLEKLLPSGGLWGELSKLPATSLTGTAITGFVAGFLSEKIWAKLRGLKG